MSYPVFSGKQASVVNRLVEAMIVDSTALRPDARYTGERSPQTAADNFLRELEQVRKEEKDRTIVYQFDLESSVLRNDAKMLTVEFSSYSFTGGAHGMTVTDYLVFDRASARRLTLEEVFAPGFEEPLNRLIEKRFRQQSGLSPSERLDSDKGGLFENRIAFTENFALTEKGVRFLYNQYDIAPYAAGQIVVDLDFNELGALLQPRYRLP